MFTQTDLYTLIDTEPEPGVSFFLPTHVHGRETMQGPIRLKNLASQAAGKLQAAGLKAGEAQSLLAPVLALVDDFDFWQHQDQGLALFLHGADMRAYKVPLPLEESVHVGRGFHVRPLLPVLAADGSFMVLSVTADDVRLFQGSRFAISQEDSSDLPRNLDQVKAAEKGDYENNQLAGSAGRPHTGTAGLGKAQVHGDSPEDWRKGRLVEYTKRIALALKERLAANPLPLVLVADAETGGHLRKQEPIAGLVAGMVEINPDVMGDDELHEAAYGVVQPQLDRMRQEAVARFSALKGSGDRRAASVLQDVAAAAWQGQVDTLLLAEGRSVWREFDAAHGRLSEDETAQGKGQDLLDRLTVHTLRQGGSVFVLPAAAMPDAQDAAAILRF